MFDPSFTLKLSSLFLVLTVLIVSFFELRKLNCFGYEKDGTSIILNYRANKAMIDAFSYLILNQTNDSLKTPPVFTGKYGILNSTIYWFYYESNLLADYFGYMKLENREI